MKEFTANEMIEMLVNMNNETREAFYSELTKDFTADEIETIRSTVFMTRMFRDVDMYNDVKSYVGAKVTSEIFG